MSNLPNGVVHDEIAASPAPPTVTVKGLNYLFPGGRPGLQDVAIDLPAGSRTLLIGGEILFFPSLQIPTYLLYPPTNNPPHPQPTAPAKPPSSASSPANASPPPPPSALRASTPSKRASKASPTLVSNGC